MNLNDIAAKYLALMDQYDHLEEELDMLDRQARDTLQGIKGIVQVGGQAYEMTIDSDGHVQLKETQIRQGRMWIDDQGLHMEQDPMITQAQLDYLNGLRWPNPEELTKSQARLILMELAPAVDEDLELVDMANMPVTPSQEKLLRVNNFWSVPPPPSNRKEAYERVGAVLAKNKKPTQAQIDALVSHGYKVPPTAAACYAVISWTVQQGNKGKRKRRTARA